MPETIRHRCYCETCEEPFAGEVDVSTGAHDCPRCGARQWFNLRPDSGGQYSRIPWRRLGWRWRGWTYSRDLG